MAPPFDRTPEGIDVRADRLVRRVHAAARRQDGGLADHAALDRARDDVLTEMARLRGLLQDVRLAPSPTPPPHR